MKVKTISVEYERKWNTGKYESMTTSFTAWADLDEDEDQGVAAEELWSYCKGQVASASYNVLSARSAKRLVANVDSNGNGNGHDGEGENDPF